MGRIVRRDRRLITVSLLIWGSATVFAAGASAEDASTLPRGSGAAQTNAAPSATPAADPALGSAVGAATLPAAADVSALRDRIEAAETQIELLKSVVVQALRAQSAAEAALRREREARDADRGGAGSPELVLADQLEALTDNLESLREEIAALRAENQAKGPAAAAEPDDFGGSGVGGEYIPLIEDESAAFAADDAIEVADEKIKVAEVHFDPDSADLTPGGRRNTLEALERIQAMAPAKVQVIGYADTVGDAGYNRHLSTQRAGAIAMLLAQVGLSDDMVEIVGNGEDGVPEPTADGISEPLNRCAGIFVVMGSPK